MSNRPDDTDEVEGCPSCGSESYWADEDGFPDCQRCGGPFFCGKCDLAVTSHVTGGHEGFSCRRCGLLFHDECFPKSKTDEILCEGCITDADLDQ